jgi:hypothetical protein
MCNFHSENEKTEPFFKKKNVYSVVNDLQIFMLFLSCLILALLSNFAWLLA